MELTDRQSLVLARLSRHAVWTEHSRVGEIILLEHRKRGGGVSIQDFPKKELLELLEAGYVACDAQQRLRGLPYWNATSYEEVTQKYWKVVKQA